VQVVIFADVLDSFGIPLGWTPRESEFKNHMEISIIGNWRIKNGHTT
jgi:hypothetical protein